MKMKLLRVVNLLYIFSLIYMAYKYKNNVLVVFPIIMILIPIYNIIAFWKIIKTETKVPFLTELSIGVSAATPFAIGLATLMFNIPVVFAVFNFILSIVILVLATKYKIIEWNKMI